MLIEKKEQRTHGSTQFPFHVYRHYALHQYFVFYHWHEEVEILYVEEGEMEVILNGFTVVLHAGDFIFINPGSLHQIQSNTTSLHHAVVYHPKLLNFENSDYVQNTIIKPLHDGSLHYPISIQDDALKSQVLPLIHKLIQAQSTNSSTSMLKVKIALFECICFLAEHKLLHVNNLYDASIHLEQVKRVITYMENHYTEIIPLTDLADLLSMHPNYFCRYFKKHTGSTCMSYLLQLRIEKGASLLSSTEMKVLDIALSCGFDNISYFIRKFKLYKGLTPIAYRQRIRSSFQNATQY